MSSQDLRTRYNAPSTRQAIARAIRTEIAGGEQIMANEVNASCRVQREGLFVPGSGKAQPTEAAIQLSKARAARVEAENEIRRRYGMPPTSGQAAWRAIQEAK